MYGEPRVDSTRVNINKGRGILTYVALFIAKGGAIYNCVYRHEILVGCPLYHNALVSRLGKLETQHCVAVVGARRSNICPRQLGTSLRASQQSIHFHSFFIE